MRDACAEATAPGGTQRDAVRCRRATVGAVARRLFDVLLSVLLLIVATPLLAVTALAILIDSGRPVLFRQTRVGRGGREFTVYKFRTMRKEADPSRHQRYVRALIEGQTEGAAENDAGLYKLVVDDRITAVGRLLRRWSLDELPQAGNVVRGEMSLVGPRPAIPYEVELYPEWYMERFAVKPGITGLWQVNGRNQRTYEEMIMDDIEYARRESLELYLRILVKTPWIVLARRGAA